VAKKYVKSLGIAVLASVMALSPVGGHAEVAAGDYLAANLANQENDYEAAARFYARALERDPNNPYLLQNALLAQVAKGDMDASVILAKTMKDVGIESQLTDLVLLAELINSEDFSGASDLLNDGEERFSPLLQGLVNGWVLLGEGQMAAASDYFDSMKSPEAMRLFGQYHKALALAVVGDFEAADEILQGSGGQRLHLNRGSITAHAEILTQIGRKDEALEILDRAISASGNKQLMDLRARIATDGEVPYDFVTNVNEGAAEVFFTLASALSGEENDRFALIYSRIATYLRPDYSDAIILTAELLRQQGQFVLANIAYSQVAEDDPAFLDAEIGRAEALLDADKPDAAIEVLRGLARSKSDVQAVHTALGDALRGQEQYAEAAESYDRAIALIDADAPAYWFLYYSRGVTYERIGEWDKAEADFRKSLALSPDQPLVLNYLGYSLVEKNEKLEEAQEMIEKAVAARPDDGFITDSLGWVLYRVGKYQEAVEPMERAVELVADDPIINDHLGDVYWAVGRKREARFQWRRALSFGPDEKDANRIRRKLDVGLDVVLQEEAEAAAGTGDAQ
jgi:tetratricopeptide (TPR) repeat protein